MSLLSNNGFYVFQQAIELGKNGELGLLRRVLNYWWALQCLKKHNKSIEVSLASSFGRSVQELQDFEGMTKDDLISLLEKRLEIMVMRRVEENEETLPPSLEELSLEVTSTASMGNEIQSLNQKLQEASTREAALERRLSELAGGPSEYVGKATSSCNDIYCIGHLRLRRHPRPGKVLLYFGAVQQHCVAQQQHDLTLWHPATNESPIEQADAADQGLRLAIQFGLDIAIVSWSEYLLDRLRLRVAECDQYADYCTVVYYSVDHNGALLKQKLDLRDHNMTTWPKGMGMLGVETEVAIGHELEEKDDD